MSRASVASSFRRGLSWAALAIVMAGPALAADKARVAVIQTGSVRDPVMSEASRFQASTERAQLAVTVDRAKVIRLPESTKIVIVGNPAIADVAIQKNGVVVVTGKSYGVTNLIALDGLGTMLAESILSVAAPSEATVVLQRGALDRQTYSCTPNCMPSVVLGDANTYFSENKGQADQHTQFATQR
jgi:Flp pilus assembly secretin CpaC